MQQSVCINTITVVTQNVLNTLSPTLVEAAYQRLLEKMSIPDPKNPNLWSVDVGGREVWGILDQHAGPNGEDVFTILFPSDY